MRTALRIDALLRQPQPLHRPSAHQVLIHYLLRVRRLHMPVPNSIGINHHHRPVFALIQAAGFVHANFAAQPRGLRKLLKLGKQFALPIGCARRPRCIGGPDIMANKDVALKNWQAVFLLKYAGSINPRKPADSRLTAPPPKHLNPPTINPPNRKSITPLFLAFRPNFPQSPRAPPAQSAKMEPDYEHGQSTFAKRRHGGLH